MAQITSNLRVDRKDNIAPHKPLLLLVIADLVEERSLTSTELSVTGELVYRFLTFWTVVAQRRSQRPDIRLPFYHMQSNGCWVPFDGVGRPAQGWRRTVGARLDENFFACLSEAAFRKDLRRILIARYFTDPGERAALYGLAHSCPCHPMMVRADAKLYEADLERGREARFRLTVVPAYNYTCALTGYRCVTVEAGSSLALRSRPLVTRRRFSDRCRGRRFLRIRR